MPLRHTLRFALAASTAAVSLAVAAPAAHAVAPTAAFDFGTPGALLAPSVGPDVAAAAATTAGTSVIPRGGAVARPVADVAAGSGEMEFPTNHGGATAWSVQATFRVVTLDRTPGVDEVDVLVLGEDGTGLVLNDLGEVRWGTAGDSNAITAPTVNAGDWLNVVVTRDAIGLTVEVENLTTDERDGGPTLLDAAEKLRAQARFMRGVADSAAQIARFRAFDGVVAEPTALQPVDVTAPNLTIYSGTEDNPATLYAGPRGIEWTYFTAGDDGTRPLAIEAAFGGDPFAPLPLDPAPEVTEPESLDSANGILAPDTDALADGQEKTLAVSTTDGAGNTTEKTVTVKGDRTAPTGLTLDPVAAGRRPAPTGAFVPGVRDDSRVGAELYRGARIPDCTTLEECGNAYVGYFADTRESNLVGGRYSFNDGLRTYEGTPIGDLPDGTYTVGVFVTDNVGNQASATSTFTITTPAATPPAAPPVVPPAAPVIPAKPTAPAASPRQLVTTFLTTALKSFGKETVGSFVKDGASVPFTATEPGTSEIQVFAGSAPKQVVAAAAAAKKVQKGLVASGKRTFRTAGTGAVKVTPTKQGKATLKKRNGATKLVIRAIFTPKGGKPVATDKTVTLKRK